MGPEAAAVAFFLQSVCSCAAGFGVRSCSGEYLVVLGQCTLYSSQWLLAGVFAIACIEHLVLLPYKSIWGHSSISGESKWLVVSCLSGSRLLSLARSIQAYGIHCTEYMSDEHSIYDIHTNTAYRKLN